MNPEEALQATELARDNWRAWGEKVARERLDALKFISWVANQNGQGATGDTLAEAARAWLNENVPDPAVGNDDRS